MNTQTKAKLCLLSTAVIWGLGFVGVQGALDAGWQAFPLLFMRGLIGGLVLFPFSIDVYKRQLMSRKL